jgi:hypothetical protein
MGTHGFSGRNGANEAPLNYLFPFFRVSPKNVRSLRFIFPVG